MECLFFINPRAGSGSGEQLATEIESFPFPVAVSKQVVFTDPARLSAQVHSCAARKDLVIICGGDGTINKIVSLLVHFPRPPVVAFIPLGTGNDLARSTGWLNSWKRLGLHGLYHAISRSETGTLDTWKLVLDEPGGQVEQVFVSYAGFGCDGRICRNFSSLEHLSSRLPAPSSIKKIFYVLPGFKVMFQEMTARKYFLTDDRYPYPAMVNDSAFSQILFLNAPSYAGGVVQAENVNFSDGKLDVIAFKSCLAYFLYMLCGRIRKFRPGLSVRDHYRFKVLLDAYYQVDGEAMGRAPSGSTVVIGHERVLPYLKPLADDMCRNLLASWKRKSNRAPEGAVNPAIT